MIDSRFLGVAEIQELTGRTRHGHQIRELCRMGIAHTVNVLGRPVVTYEAVRRYHGLSNEPEVKASGWDKSWMGV